MTACVTDLHLEAWIEWRAARAALRTRDDATNRTRMDTAQQRIDDLFDAAHDCE